MELRVSKRIDHMINVMVGVLLGLALFHDDLPIIPILYGLMTAESVFFGIIFLRSKGTVRKWMEEGVPEAVRVKFTRLQAYLYFCNAAICPLGLLAWHFLRFDQDFILIAQIVGFAAVGFLSFVPLKQKKVRYQQHGQEETAGGNPAESQ